MRPTTVGLLLVILVTGGLWSQGKFLSIKHAIAAGVFTIFLTVIFQIDRKFGEALSILALVAVGWIYIVPIVANVDKASAGPSGPSAGVNPPFLQGQPGQPNLSPQGQQPQNLLDLLFPRGLPR